MVRCLLQQVRLVEVYVQNMPSCHLCLPACNQSKEFICAQVQALRQVWICVGQVSVQYCTGAQRVQDAFHMDSDSRRLRELTHCCWCCLCRLPCLFLLPWVQGMDAWAVDTLVGRTALHYAAQHNWPGAVEALLQASNMQTEPHVQQSQQQMKQKEKDWCVALPSFKSPAAVPVYARVGAMCEEEVVAEEVEVLKKSRK